MLMAFLFQQEGTVRGDLWGLTAKLISGGSSTLRHRWILSAV
jgi:hypothetical protein